jgi:hypothetical protein
MKAQEFFFKSTVLALGIAAILLVITGAIFGLVHLLHAAH